LLLGKKATAKQNRYKKRAAEIVPADFIIHLSVICLLKREQEGSLRLVKNAANLFFVFSLFCLSFFPLFPAIKTNETK
jgi:hypothetical protein